MDSPAESGQLLHSLNAVVNFLHTEGFFAAEETLLREIENRYPAPDAISPRGVSASPGGSSGDGVDAALATDGRHSAGDSAGAACGSLGGVASSGANDVETVDFQPALAAAAAHTPLLPVDSMDSAEKVLEAWRSKSTTPAASPKKATALSPPSSPPSAPKPWPAYGLQDGGSSSDVDEYDDDDDPGFLRLDVVGQEAALGFELGQFSEASGQRDVAYYQPPKDDPHERCTATLHARHASIDMGLLNRQLHGVTSSASSSHHGHSKQQQRQQQLMLHEPVSSSEHWRGESDAALLPPGVPGPTSGQDGSSEALTSPPLPQHTRVVEGPSATTDVQQSGSPCASSDGGGSSFFSGELAGSPVKRSPAGHKRSSSYAQRQAGTAQWVFDRANSADADAYRSLLNHLDRPAAGQHTTLAPQEQRRRRRQPALLPPPALARKQIAERHVATGDSKAVVEVEVETGSLLFHQESISRVSSLGESMLQEAVALSLCDAAQEAQQGGEQELAADAGMQQQQQQPQQQPPQQLHQQQQLDRHGYETVELVASHSPRRRLEQPLPALRTVGGRGHMDGLPQLHSPSTVADTTGALRGSECDCSSPHGSSAHTPDGASIIIDYSDPFSFPVTPPSEVAPVPDPAPLFGSWTSFKSSPDRKSGGLGGYGTEDESTPARRRYQQQAAVAAAAAAAAAKEACGNGGGVQRSIKFPPLGAGTGLGGGGLQGYGSSSQLLTYATPARALVEEGLGSGAEFDQDYFDSRYEVLNLKVIHRRHCTGFEQARELPLHIDDLIAGRYQIVDLLGQAAFSRAVQALDLKTGALVCLKIIKNNKDYFDQGLDEVKLLQYVNAADPQDEAGLLRLHDFFYFKEHLVLVTELLRANLYEFQKYNRESGDEPYFTLPRIQSIARQVLTSLAFLHSLGLVHADLKPENILVKSYSQCRVKVIDLGSSCFLTDHLSSYVQSRSYRAPEVILGLPYDQKVDVWSLGCVLAELATGKVLFQNESIATLLARLEGILRPLPRWMLHRGRYAHKYYMKDGRVYEKSVHSGRYEYLRPKATSLAWRVPQADEGMLSFLKHLLQVDPTKRPSAAQALHHPWLEHQY